VLGIRSAKVRNVLGVEITRRRFQDRNFIDEKYTPLARRPDRAVLAILDPPWTNAKHQARWPPH
jgi:hypothetical protein